MQKMRKVMAVALSATMVMGNAVTTFAAPGDVSGVTPIEAGGTQGAGTSEGHVEKEVLEVLLPTIAEGTSPLAYTMDPERLIQETAAARYEDYTLPEAASDTGVYFLTGDKTFANTSETLQAVNLSSCPVTLSVKVKATAGANDIALANSSTLSTTNPELYLGLKVGNTTEVVSTTESTVTKTIDGNANNFETVFENGAYAYKAKADASAWKAVNISMTGAVNQKQITETTTAPTVDVTWSMAKAADGATVDTDVVDYSAGPSVTLSADGVITMSGLTADKNYAHSAILTFGDNLTNDLDSDPNMAWVVDDWTEEDGGTLIFRLNQAWLNALSGIRATITVKLTDGTTISAAQQF